MKNKLPIWIMDLSDKSRRKILSRKRTIDRRKARHVKWHLVQYTTFHLSDGKHHA